MVAFRFKGRCVENKSARKLRSSDTPEVPTDESLDTPTGYTAIQRKPHPSVPASPVGKKSSKGRHQHRWKSVSVFERFNFVQTPFVTKASFISLLLTVIALTTPNWISLTTAKRCTHYGLWHYCDHKCDYVISRSIVTSDLPAWYLYARVCYSIGTACSLVVLMIIRQHTHYGPHMQWIRWSTLKKRTALCLTAISVLQQFMTLTVFCIQGLQDNDHPLAHLTSRHEHDLQPSFYCALFAIATSCAQLISIAIYSP